MLILNKLMILISVVLLLLCILEPMRKVVVRKRSLIQKILSPHAVYGVLLLITSFIHGILSGKKTGNDDGKTDLALPVITSMSISFEKKNEKGEMDSNPSRIYRRSLHIDSNTYYSCNYLVKSEG